MSADHQNDLVDGVLTNLESAVASTSRDGGISAAEVDRNTKAKNDVTVAAPQSSRRPRTALRFHLRPPVSCVFLGIALLVAAVTLTVVVVVTVDRIGALVSAQAENYVNQAVDRVTAITQRHFDGVRGAADFIQIHTHYQYILQNFSQNMGRTVEAFGSFSLKFGVHILCYNNQGDGWSMGPYSPSDSDFRAMPGYVVVQTSNGSSATRNVQYFNADSGTSFGLAATKPRTFNYLARPYSVAFFSKYTWFTPYVSVVTQTLGIPIGGPFGSMNLSSRLQGAASFSVHDYTVDLVDRLGNLKLSANSKAMLFHVPTKAFLGGNIADPTLITLPNGTLAVRPIDMITDPHVSSLLQRYGSQLIAACVMEPQSGTAGCMSPTLTPVYRYVLTMDGSLLTSTPSAMTALFALYQLIRVVPVTDPYGLNLAIVIVMPSHDFAGSLRDAMQQGVLIACGVLVLLVLVASLVVHLLLTPLRAAGETLMLEFYSNFQLSSSGEAGVDALDVSHRESYWYWLCPDLCSSTRWARSGTIVREVALLGKLLNRFRKEMTTVRSFVPESALLRVPLRSHEKADHSALDTEHSSIVEDVHRKIPTAPPSLVLTIISLSVTDMVGFHNLRSHLLPTQLEALHAEYMDRHKVAAVRNGGVVSMFYGDKVFVTFNAEQPLHGSTHATAAVNFALMLDQQLATPFFGDARVKVHMGIASGQALAGNIGPVLLRRFHVVGECLHQAFSLCEEGKANESSAVTPILCSWRTRHLCLAVMHHNRPHADDEHRHKSRTTLWHSDDVCLIACRLANLPYESRVSVVFQASVKASDEATMFDDAYPHSTRTHLCSPSVQSARKRFVSINNEAYEAVCAKQFKRALELLREIAIHPKDSWLLEYLLQRHR